jgi:hypothetical protein
MRTPSREEWQAFAASKAAAERHDVIRIIAAISQRAGRGVSPVYGIASLKLAHRNASHKINAT